ncbi:MAG: GcvT family protein, partial [Aestuariivirgaceae bacterium]
MAELPDNADIVIIGGGVIGLSIACHLGWRGAEDVILIERHQLTSGTSWHAAGIIGPLRATMNLTRLSVYALEAFDRLERETGQSTGYRRTGGFWLAQNQDRMTELKRIADLGLLAGLDARIMTADEIKARLDLLETADLAGGMWVEEDGQANPVDVCMAYAKAARSNGVRIFENAPVKTVHTKQGAVHSVELTGGHTVRCDKVVNCAGAWARDLGARSSIAIPLQAVEHMYVVSEPVKDLPQPFPILRDLEARIYIKEDAGKLVLGGFEPNAKPFEVTGTGGDVPFLELPQDWQQFEPFMLAGLNRIPALGECGIQHFMNGPESFTPNTKQVMGEAPECRNYFVAAGFNSIGIISSAGAGRVMADWIIDGVAPMDISDLDITRFEADMAAPGFLNARVREAVASQFEMHWPYKQMKTGRDLRRLPAHDVWRDAGAVFGAPAGWERPLWFAADEYDCQDYSYGDQPWWPAAERECIATRDAAVLIDLSPFSKFEISGREALAGLQHACSADIAVAVNRSVYTLLLNHRGGIEADGTVTRLDADRFVFVGAAPSRRRDLAWLQRNLGPVDLKDATRDMAVLALMGPSAGDVWIDAGGNPDALTMPFGASAEFALADTRLRAVRISFIGEFGWELYLPWDEAPALASHLMASGAGHGLMPIGLHTIDCCRMEKGFRHWGHDIGPDDTPLEAGLAFAVGWTKDRNFIGRTALG